MGVMSRLILEKSAAKKWGVDHVECRAENYFVVHSFGKKIAFGSLVDLAKDIAIPSDHEIALKQ